MAPRKAYILSRLSNLTKSAVERLSPRKKRKNDEKENESPPASPRPVRIAKDIALCTAIVMSSHLVISLIDMDRSTDTEQKLRTAQHTNSKLREQLLKVEKDHEETTRALIEEVEDLKYQLSVTKWEKENAAARLLEKQHQFYALRKVVYEVGLRLTARESHTSNKPLAAQLAEHRRFIASIGGKLEDGARGVIKEARERNNMDDE
ncbi:hypothetical protein GGX14DRAFT_388515 [Mycena pura]|uniref:Uncharacterized protein n=1 Tax=Mycena pura TaxID=153505 RepID=A0AAD6VV48_9AGAR|nr:hypothetical protein GGX14DRAFT_388515 [Mycena pura]